MICRSRTYCLAMLSMWRAKHRWFHLEETELAPTFPIKDWWDGTKAKEVSWFWDSEATWELPVACSLCLEVYQTFPRRPAERCVVSTLGWFPVCLDRVSEHLDGRDEDSKYRCQFAIAAYARIVHPQYQRGPVK
ncbi:hypothetical protein R1sor_016269 [Riccia sorocarpa]|uniref:Uncharacterized protein n=1 Tax=Riccia sorocarpa TaxID=122646 RepID=A0ABD3HIM4_9MARC